jgi:hypothetical protein
MNSYKVELSEIETEKKYISPSCFLFPTFSFQFLNSPELSFGYGGE